MTDSKCATLLQWVSYLLILAGVLIFLFAGIDELNRGNFGSTLAAIGVLVGAAFMYGFSVIVRAAQAYINKCKDEEPAEE